MSGPERDDAMRAAAREVLRELLLDLRQTDAVNAGGNGNGHGRTNGETNGHTSDRDAAIPSDHEAVIPMVPAPPVAAVLRPSTWSGPAAPGEVIGEPAPAQPGEPRPPSPRPAAPEATDHGAGPAPRATPLSSETRVESVTITNDDDLEHFVRALVARVDSPRDRLAIRSGRLRFVLRTPGATLPAAADSAGIAAATPPGGPRSDIRAAKGPVTERVVREAAVRGGRLLVARGAVVTPLARDCARAMDVKIEKERTC
jgi:hypothetical protein